MRFFYCLILMFSFNVTVWASGPVEMKGNYVWTALGERGTVGMGHQNPPGIRHDPAGTQNFPDATWDYLTPETPYEFFSVRTNETNLVSNNNAISNQNNISNGSLTTGIPGYDHGATWTGTYGSSFQITNQQFFNNNEEKINIKTRIKALTNLTGVKFARGIDPDAGSKAPGGTTSSTNQRGYGSIPPTQGISSTSGTASLFLALYTNGVVKDQNGNIVSGVTTNSSASPWSNDPDFYLTNSLSTTGDDVIGLAFNLGDMAANEEREFIYAYVMSRTEPQLEANSTADPGAERPVVEETTPTPPVVGENPRTIWLQTLPSSIRSEAALQATTLQKDIHHESAAHFKIAPVHDVISFMSSEVVTPSGGSLSSSFLSDEKTRENTLNNFMASRFKSLESNITTPPPPSFLTPASYQGASYNGSSLGVEKTRHHNEALSIPSQSTVTGPYRAWIQPFGVFSHQDSTNNHPGVKQKSAGLLVGVDKKLSPHWLMGILVGNSLDDYTIKNNLGQGKIKTGFAGVYTSYTHEKGFHWDGSFIGMMNHHNEERGMPLLKTASFSQHKSYGMSARARFGYRFILKNQSFSLDPFLAIGAQSTKENAYQEKGSSPFNLKIPSESDTLLSGEWGVTLKKWGKSYANTLQGFITFSALYEKPMRKNKTQRLSFVDDATTFTNRVTIKEKLYGSVAMGLSKNFSKGITLSSFVKGFIGANSYSAQFLLKLTKQF